jgi:cation diffusion facilitator CzcD-associated flavoprotein CzcO
VLVVGSGASAYDLLELCLKHRARRIAWVYRTTRWMRPTQKPKNIAADTRALAKLQMLGDSAEKISRDITQDFRQRYEKFGLQASRGGFRSAAPSAHPRPSRDDRALP